jgi:hypothetical protein
MNFDSVFGPKREALPSDARSGRQNTGMGFGIGLALAIGLLFGNFVALLLVAEFWGKVLENIDWTSPLRLLGSLTILVLMFGELWVLLRRFWPIGDAFERARFVTLFVLLPVYWLWPFGLLFFLSLIPPD